MIAKTAGSAGSPDPSAATISRDALTAFFLVAFASTDDLYSLSQLLLGLGGVERNEPVVLTSLNVATAWDIWF